MTKYQSADIRTGYNVGEIVELEEKELNKLAFNVFMRKIEPVDERNKLEEDERTKKEEELKVDLKNKGLSLKRIEKVMGKFGSIEDLKRNSGKIGIDELTDEFLAKEYSKPKIKKGGD